VSDLAPQIALTVRVLKARETGRTDVGGRDIPYHAPSMPSRQSLLITSEPIGAQGWGWPPSCVVSRQRLEWKAANGGDPADLLIHEWLHTLAGMTIDGRPVPFADDAETHGFAGTPGPDGDDTWHEWYRYALGRG
jgi:hypothetical protein